DRGHAAGDRAEAEAHAVGVAAAHAHALEWHAQLGGGDLRQRGLVRLALGADPDVHEDVAARVDADVGALEGAEARALDVRGDTEPERPRTAASRRLLLAPARPVEPLEQRVEGGHVVGWV